jgi:DNA-binding transcriptional MerR regulator
MIVSLRQLGLPLREIGDWLSRPDTSPCSVIELHLTRLREKIDEQQALYRRLEAIAERLRTAEEVSAEDFLTTMEMIAMYDKYYTEEQRQTIEERGRQLGPEAIRAVEKEWPELIAKVRAEMEKGTDPTSETVQALARRWMELVQAFTGSDPGITQSLRTMYREEEGLRERTGLDGEIMEYVSRASAGLK